MPGTLTFGYPGDDGLGDRLLAAVLRGEKTATSSLAVEYLAGDALPRVGERLRLTDHDGRVHGVVETTRTAIVPLPLVGDDVAWAEGEGYADAAAWRAGHVRFWREVREFVRADAGDPGWELRDEEPVVVHWFRLVQEEEPALAARCARPFALEAQKLLEERVAGVAEIDRVVRAAGFPEGPFEQQDRVGVGVALAAAREAWEQGFGEPRWRPSPLAAQLVAAGRLGAAAGRGWYEHAEGRALRPDDPPAPEPGGGRRRLVIVTGDALLAHELRMLAEEADFRVEEAMGADVPWLIVVAGPPDEDDPPLQGAPQVLLCAEGSLHQLDPGGASVGFHALSPLAAGAPAELVRGTHTSALAATRAEAFFAAAGLATAWVGDAPGLVLGRIACQLVNEAAFALAEGAASDPAALDEAAEHALGAPRGPLSWGDEIGLEHVLAVLDALRLELGEERYRAAPLLRRMVADGTTGMAAGQGFYAYEEAG